jgi:Na+/H+ antiporter NhaD/arsenite permease-like protein
VATVRTCHRAVLIGAVAAADGLFEALGGRLAHARLGARGLLLALLGLVAAVTAVLNLDTSVVFLTPVLVHAARRRRLDERPFLYGSVFMANAASLLLPGSNLTNLLVLRGDPQSSVAFAARMLPAWIAACAITAAFPPAPGSGTDRPSCSTRAGCGRRLGLAQSHRCSSTTSPQRCCSQPSPAHPNALLLWLDIGPNLAFTGSLSAVLWLQAARAVSAHASLRDYSRLGVVLVPATLALTLAALVMAQTGI